MNRSRGARRSYFPAKWTPPVSLAPVSHTMRPCHTCGTEVLLPVAEPDADCFKCWREANPCEGVPAARIDAAGDDSKDPRRIADGTAHINLGLPGVEKVVGVRSSWDPNLHGKPQLEYRPLTNAEVGSNRRRLELAKRAGLDVVEKHVYRALPK